jgi:hypothetical protein
MNAQLERFFEECRTEVRTPTATGIIDALEEAADELCRRGVDEPEVQAEVDQICEIVAQKNKTLRQRLEAIAQYLRGLPPDSLN